MSDEEKEASTSAMSPKIVCGIVMPISTNDAGTESHWGEVKSIISDSIRSAAFEPNLVSEADDVGVIHKRIIQNLYQNEIVVCDVSGINPNVMFELGIRLAFDKPTVIVKDDQTKYPFDTGPIEYVSYRRDLRFASIVDFKATLSKKLSATLLNSKKEGYTTFLRSFGEFTIAQIEAKEIPEFDFLVGEIRNLRSLIVANSRVPESNSPWEDSDPIRVFFDFRKRVEFAGTNILLVNLLVLQSLLSEAERLYPLLATSIHHDECRQIAEYLRMLIKRKESQ